MKKNDAKKHVQIWEKVWEGDSYASPRIRKKKAKRKIEELLSMLPEKLTQQSVVLDAGCGGGYVSEYLIKRTNVKIIAFDQSEKAIDICRDLKVSDKMQVLKADASRIPYDDQTADLALCIGLLEHLRDYDACIEEIRRILKKDGYLYVVSSNKYSAMYIQWFVKHLLGRWKYGYQKNWTPNQLSRILERHSFRQIELKVIEGWGNFDSLSQIDRILRKQFKYIGRYVVYLGQKK